MWGKEVWSFNHHLIRNCFLNNFSNALPQFYSWLKSYMQSFLTVWGNCRRCFWSLGLLCWSFTMDVLNRLKSAVSNVLPVGNPITGEFDILGHRASGGPAMMWKIFDGIQKSTKQVENTLSHLVQVIWNAICEEDVKWAYYDIFIVVGGSSGVE